MGVTQKDIARRLNLSQSLVARVLANGYRADVRAAGFGNGCGGFAGAIPAGVKGRISVRRALDGAEVGCGGAVGVPVACHAR